MIHDICLHGTVGNRYEFYTTVVGTNLNVRFFHEHDEENGNTCDRFFSGGNEIRLHADRLLHRGTGGSFCSYMFGVERPIKDVLKRDVRNRLVIYGVRSSDGDERLGFSNETDGLELYDRIFRDGHILTNYFFFISGDIQGGVKGAQEMILRLAGKFLKREDLTSDTAGTKLARELYKELGIPKWTLFLIRLTDTVAENYARAFREVQRGGKPLRAAERSRLDLAAKQSGLGWTQQERIEICVAAEHPENAALISQYEETLTARYTHNISEAVALPRLNRLRALGTKRHLPAKIFDRLDKLVRSGDGHPTVEPPYVAELRRIFQSLFVDGAPDASPDLIVTLLHLKRQAVENRSLLFDNALAEIGRDADSRKQQNTDEGVVEIFHNVAAHFDRYDTLNGILNGVAFIDDYDLTEDRIYTLARNRVIFENIREGLFDELHFMPLFKNAYLNTFGHNRLTILQQGTADIVAGESTPKAVIEAVAEINRHLKIRRSVDECVRRLVRDLHKKPLDKQEQAFLRKTVGNQLMLEGVTAEPVSEELFTSVLLGLREEQMYLNELFPQIVNLKDRRLREDFLENGGLDRFRVEEIEHAYLESLHLPQSTLDFLSDFSDAKGVPDHDG